jgi:hypothetical protein
MRNVKTNAFFNEISPKQKCKIPAACARSGKNAAGARTKVLLRGGEIGHSCKTRRNQSDEPTNFGTMIRPRVIFDTRYFGPCIQPLLLHNDF